VVVFSSVVVSVVDRFDDAVARNVLGAGQLHALLSDESGE
jgi:hypothetical protein